jgi:hypothetical protein
MSRSTLEIGFDFGFNFDSGRAEAVFASVEVANEVLGVKDAAMTAAETAIAVFLNGCMKSPPFWCLRQAADSGNLIAAMVRSGART